MINLLPPQEKKELKQEENWRVVLILGVLLMFFLISFSLILFSIKSFIAGEVEAQKIILEQKEEEFADPYLQNLQKNLINFNRTLSELNSFYQGKAYFTSILEKISGILPAKTYFTNISSSQGEEELRCSLSGFSPDRDLLLEFKSNLESRESFDDFNFPPSNWVKPSDINFTASFKINENRE